MEFLEAEHQERARVITGAMIQAVMSLPLNATTGEVMNCCMHMLIDAGMDDVRKGNTTREQLREHICRGAADLIEHWDEIVGKVTIQ